MIHPLVLAIHAMDGLTLALLIFPGTVAFQVLSVWLPGTAERRQLLLEARTETAAIATRWAFLSFALASLMLVVAVATELPPLVPGAMCGTGVLQASRGRLAAALTLRGLALLLLHLWRVLDSLDRTRPEAPLALPLARLLLVALPAVVVAGSETLGALWNLDLHAPVSCCALVYDAARPTAAAAGSALPAWALLWPLALGVPLLFGLSAHIVRHGLGRGSCAIMGMLTIAWAPLAGMTHVRFLSPYVYGVMQHHCPWCLFLPVHGAVGFPLLLSLVALALEGAAGWLAGSVGKRVSALRPAAEQRTRQSALRVATALALFLFCALLPALGWRLRFGVWLS